MTKNTKNQPKVKETIEGERNIRLHHIIKLTRQEFDRHVGNTAQMLLDKGTIDLDSTEFVRN